MIIDNEIRLKLLNNWGAKAESLEAYAYVRLFTPQSNWDCYIFAMNHDDNNVVSCIVNGHTLEIDQACSLEDIKHMFNFVGYDLETDYSFRPRKAVEIYKQLLQDRVQI